MKFSEDSSIRQYPSAGYMIDPPKQIALSRQLSHDLAVKGFARLYVWLEQEEQLEGKVRKLKKEDGITWLLIYRRCVQQNIF